MQKNINFSNIAIAKVATLKLFAEVSCFMDLVNSYRSSKNCDDNSRSFSLFRYFSLSP